MNAHQRRIRRRREARAGMSLTLRYRAMADMEAAYLGVLRDLFAKALGVAVRP